MQPEVRRAQLGKDGLPGRPVPPPCRLDELLGGGLREGTVLEVAGETSSGKTQLALAVAALSAARGEALVWVDTTGSFAPQRLVAMAGLGGPGAVQQVGLRGMQVCLGAACWVAVWVAAQGMHIGGVQSEAEARCVRHAPGASNRQFWRHNW